MLRVDAAEQVGGPLQRIHFRPRNVAGYEDGDGRALASRYATQLEQAGVEILLAVRAAGLTAPVSSGAPVIVQFADGTSRAIAEVPVIIDERPYLLRR